MLEESIKQLWEEAPSEEARAQLVLDLLDRVETCLGDAPAPLKITVALRLGALWAIPSGITAHAFAATAGRIYIDTTSDLKDYATAKEE